MNLKLLIVINKTKKMSKEVNVSNYGGGISFTGLLTIVFIALKLTGVINWSWLLVLLPMLIPIGVVAVLLFCYLFIAIALIASSYKSKKKDKK